VLSEPESEKLFEIIRGLQERGVAILYVSHRLPEILKICHRIVVLRDGVKVADQTPNGLTEGDLANLMVGRKLEDIFPTQIKSTNETAMQVTQ
jgi:ABC-type sugar transport system ATPase subunit